MGPYAQDGGWRYKIVSSGSKEWAPMARSQRQAMKLAEKAARIAASQGSITVMQAIEMHVEDKRDAGARQQTLEGTKTGLTAYFASMLDTPVGKLTARVCQKQYDRMRLEIIPSTGKVPAVSTHRVRLGQAKNFALWVLAKGWLREDPTAGVKGIGKKRRGKVQLSLDEARRLSSTCVTEAGQGISERWPRWPAC